ncbi:hypothetical protein [Vibrio cionasavignyae]|uniref:hypothetical protein n=1 Tax=Vibrio cionasavignyae TaxID=2910252 RepID=UPI003D0CFDCA
MKSDYLSPPDAIRSLFHVELSKHKSFKDHVYPLIRSKGFLDVHRESMGSASDKNHLLVSRKSLDKLHNAVILQGFFSDTKRVKAIFTDQAKRLEAAQLLESLLLHRQSILGVSVSHQQIEELLSVLRSDTSLEENKLPNPFEELPQLSLNGLTSVMQALLAQSATLNQSDTMIGLYLEGNLDKAYQAAITTNSSHPVVKKYQETICRQYEHAKEFDNFLEELLN